MLYSSTISENQHWQAFVQGDREAFGVLYQLYFKQLYNYGNKFSRDNKLVEDAIQDLFIKLWTNKANLNQPISVKNYLFKALRSNIFRKLAQNAKFTADDDLAENYDFDISLSAETLLIASETEQIQIKNLQNSLENLTQRQKEAIFLRFNENLGYEEIANLMDISVKATYKLVYRALEVLREGG